MKKTELMIGDWVKTPANPCYQVVLGDFWREDESNLTLFSVFSPIPITPEILEKNGWDLDNTDIDDGANLYAYGDYDNCLLEWWEKGSFESSLFSCRINGVNLLYEFPMTYVHELQHALKLCELNDLADNFKI